MKRLLILLAIVGLWAVPIGAQVIATMSTNTTLSAAMNASQTTMLVGSATGFTVGNFAWTGLEVVRITSVSGTTIGVQRGQMGTVSRGHASSQIVVTGAAQHFQQTDPDTKAACTAGSGQAGWLPWINVTTGNVWVCTLGSVWVGTNTQPLTWNSINLTR